MIYTFFLFLKDSSRHYLNLETVLGKAVLSWKMGLGLGQE